LAERIWRKILCRKFKRKFYVGIRIANARLFQAAIIAATIVRMPTKPARRRLFASAGIPNAKYKLNNFYQQIGRRSYGKYTNIESMPASGLQMLASFDGRLLQRNLRERAKGRNG